MSVRTNADTPEQTANAIAFGAVGIGLTRTEHMFFEGDRIDAMREMILAETLEEAEGGARQAAAVPARRLRRHLPGAEGLPGDDPLPRSAAARVPAAHQASSRRSWRRRSASPAARIHQRVEGLHEFNPMLGFRGCRLGIGYPEISAMQARAVFEAAAIVQKEGIKVRPEIMIPLVGFKKELDLQIEVVHQAAREVQAEKKVKLNYMVGTMIEIPRGALTADEIAQSAEFFSFGTNDLTQTGLGMSRDDSGSFLPQYQELEIVKKNPFATIDAAGVGQLVEIAVTKGRATRPDIKLGICGEHGGDPASIQFFEKVGLDYVSCSPYRVPVARLAAAQAALQVKAGGLRDHRSSHTTNGHDHARPIAVDPAWLAARRARSGVWVDIDEPTPEGGGERSCSDVFHFHELAVEDALSELHHPKIESYGDYLYVILHGIDFRGDGARASGRRTSTSSSAELPRHRASRRSRARSSRSRRSAPATRMVLGEGPAALMHRIVDAMVDNYRPEMDELQDGSTSSRRGVRRRSRQLARRTSSNFKRTSRRCAASSSRSATSSAASRAASSAIINETARRTGSATSTTISCGSPTNRCSSGPHHQPARREPVDRLEPAEPGHEDPDRHRDDLHAADVHHRPLRHERRRCRTSACGGSVLLGLMGDHGRHRRHDAGSSGGESGSEVAIGNRA